MKPMLARTVGPKFAHFPCYVQPKLNGIRALYQAGTFQSRDEKIWKPGVLSHLSKQLSSLSLRENLILDGELYVHGWRLQRINGAVAVNRLSPISDTLHVCYYIFDVLTHGPFASRWFDLYQPLLSCGLSHVVAVPTAFVSSRPEMEQHFHHYTKLGYEGIMLRPDGPYELGETPQGTEKRSNFLWKYKLWEDAEFLCVGVTLGDGKAAIGIGALVLQAPDSSHTFKCGTGFSDEERIEFAQTPPLNRLIKVKYNPALTEDGIPTHAAFLAAL